MPIPFLLAGLGVLAGIVGLGGHVSANETNERAHEIIQDAKDLYNDAEKALRNAKNKTEKTLMKLGYDKKNVLDTSMKQFLESYDKVKHIQVENSVGMNELSNFTIDQQGSIEIKELTNIYSSSFASSAAGATAGIAVTLAASGALPIITGEFALAGSALAAGELGAAAGLAGSAISLGAAMTPLAAIAAPVVLFSGISASIKADENLEEANATYAKAEAAAEKMKISETLCDAITERTEMFDELLKNLNEMFAECSSILAGVIRHKEGRIFKRKLTSDRFSESELKLIAVTRALAGAIKSVIDIPILSKDGNLTTEGKTVYDQTVEKLPEFSQVAQEVKTTNDDVKPIVAKLPKKERTKEHSKNIRKKIPYKAIMSVTRKVLAIIMGLFFSSIFVWKININLPGDTKKFLFVDAHIVNMIAIWLLLCTLIIMLIGDFSDTIVEGICRCGSGLSLFILYVQYCRSVEQMEHYIIFPILFCAASIVIVVLLNAIKDDWDSGYYFSRQSINILFWPIGFIFYAFLSKFLEFPESSCLIFTSVIFLIITAILVVKSYD